MNKYLEIMGAYRKVSFYNFLKTTFHNISLLRSISYILFIIFIDFISVFFIFPHLFNPPYYFILIRVVLLIILFELFIYLTDINFKLAYEKYYEKHSDLINLYEKNNQGLRFLLFRDELGKIGIDKTYIKKNIQSINDSIDKEIDLLVSNSSLIPKISKHPVFIFISGIFIAIISFIIQKIITIVFLKIQPIVAIKIYLLITFLLLYLIFIILFIISAIFNIKPSKERQLKELKLFLSFIIKT